MTTPLRPLTADDVAVVGAEIAARVRPDAADLRSILIRPVPATGELEITLDPHQDPRAVPAVLHALTNAGYPNRAMKSERTITIFVSTPHALAGHDSSCVRCGAQGAAVMRQCSKSAQQLPGSTTEDLAHATGWKRSPGIMEYVKRSRSAPADSDFSINLPDVLTDVDLAMSAAGTPLHAWMNVNRADLAACHPVDFVDLILQFGLTYLAANGMITVSPEGAFEQPTAVDLERPYADAMAELLDRAVSRRAGFSTADRAR